jgi:TolB-like protein/tetratricopeptide (TPR) repeat protein
MSERARHVYEFGPFRLDAAERSLVRAGRAVTLTPKAFDLLVAMIENRGRLLEKEDLIKKVWPDSFVEEGNLAVTVFMLRKALGDGPDEIQYIETVPRRGYRFVADVRERPQNEAASEAEQVPQPRALRSIAVLPFKPLSPDGSDEYLGRGMADGLITRLGNISQITVRPTSAVLKYAGRDLDALTTGFELGVESVLEGSIRRSGERIRVTVQMVSVRDRKPLWADKFDEQFTDIFAVEDSITERVAAALTLRLTGEELRQMTRHYTENTEAYNLCLKGRFFFSKETEDGVKKGIEYLRQAIEIDPEYALAHAWIADCYCWLSHFYMPPKEVMPKAKEAARRATQIDDSLAEGHTSLALVSMWYDWNFAESERAFKRAIEINPKYAAARLWHSFFLTAMGHTQEAMSEITLAHELDPLSLFINSGVGFPLYYSRQYSLAIERAEKLIEMEPYLWTVYWLHGIACVETKEFDRARDSLQKAIAFSAGGAEMIAALGHAYARAGQAEDARNVLEQLKNMSRQRYVSPYHVATIHAGLGQNDQAIARLEEAYLDRSEWLVWLAVDPKMDPLRQDHRFQNLLSRVGI